MAHMHSHIIIVAELKIKKKKLYRKEKPEKGKKQVGSGQAALLLTDRLLHVANPREFIKPSIRPHV